MAIQLASAGCFRVVYGLEERAQPWVWGRSGGAVGQVQTTRDIGAMAQYSGRRQGRQQRGEESERQQGPSRKGGGQAEEGRKRGGQDEPEHVYGQKCESPRLAIALGNG